MNHTSNSSIRGPMSRRYPSLLILMFFLTGSAVTAEKSSGRQVTYVAGMSSQIQVGCKGTLDARDPKSLLITCGGKRLEISISAIELCRMVDSEQVAKELGLGDIAITRRTGYQLIYIRTVGSMGSRTWLLLELPAKYARELIAYLIQMKEDRDASPGNAKN